MVARILMITITVIIARHATASASNSLPTAASSSWYLSRVLSFPTISAFGRCCPVWQRATAVPRFFAWLASALRQSAEAFIGQAVCDADN